MTLEEGPFAYCVNACRSDIEHEKEAIKFAQKMLLRVDGERAQLFEELLADAEYMLKMAEAGLEYYRDKHFEWIDQQEMGA